MKILVSWLRDFVDVTASPDDIARTMSVRGFAVESIEPIALPRRSRNCSPRGRTCSKRRRRCSNASPYAFSVSRNRTGSPVDGVATSPCHITRLPRTKVPTGQPVTRTPS